MKQSLNKVIAKSEAVQVRWRFDVTSLASELRTRPTDPGNQLILIIIIAAVITSGLVNFHIYEKIMDFTELVSSLLEDSETQLTPWIRCLIKSEATTLELSEPTEQLAEEEEEKSIL